MSQETAARKARRKEASPWASVLSVIAFASVLGVGGVLGYQAYDDSLHTQVPTAPATLDTDSEACTPFEDAELNCSIEWDTDETRERGTLVSQSLPPDARVTKESDVSLVYSKGPSSSRLPELRNETVESANEILYPLGLSVVETEVVNDSGLGEGRIVSGDIATDTSVENGTVIEVTVSSGMVTVPDWVKEPKETVEVDALNKNITVIFEEVETDGPAGIVISQSETGLTEMATTVTVKVSVAKKIESLKVPDILEMSLEDAQLELVTRGFTEINIIREVSPDVDEVVVSEVKPGVGATVESDSAVTIVVLVPEK